MSLSRFGSIRRRAAGVASAAGLLSFVAMGVPGLSADSVDFNHDGVPETLIHQPGKTVLQKPEGQPVDFQFPEGVSVLDAQGKDSGLRWVDLNGDGFADLIQSHPEGYAIHLWNRTVRAELGWTKGWSQFVRSGRRTGADDEPPSLVGTTVRAADGVLIIETPATSAQPARTQRISARELIAVRMPPPKSPEEALACTRIHSAAGLLGDVDDGRGDGHAGGLGGAEIVEVVGDLVEFLRADDQVHIGQLVEEGGPAVLRHAA